MMSSFLIGVVQTESRIYNNSVHELMRNVYPQGEIQILDGQLIFNYSVFCYWRALKPGSHDSISIRAKQKAKQRNEVKPAT